MRSRFSLELFSYYATRFPDFVFLPAWFLFSIILQIDLLIVRINHARTNVNCNLVKRARALKDLRNVSSLFPNAIKSAPRMWNTPTQENGKAPVKKCTHADRKISPAVRVTAVYETHVSRHAPIAPSKKCKAPTIVLPKLCALLN